MAISRPSPRVGGSGAGGPPRPSVMLEPYIHLPEYLTLEQWDDGSARKTATLLVFSEEGLWKVCLNDRACERSLWSSGETLDAACDSVERMLATGTGEWRQSKPGRRR